MKKCVIDVRDMAKPDRIDDPSIKNADEVARTFGADIEDGSLQKRRRTVPAAVPGINFLSGGQSAATQGQYTAAMENE